MPGSRGRVFGLTRCQWVLYCAPVARKNPPSAARSRLAAHWLPALAVALTFLIRLWFILEMRGRPFSTITAQTIDSWQYHVWAMDILRNFWGNEVFFMRPLYPYLLAALYRVFGIGLLPVQSFQAVLATVSCLLLYDSTRRIFRRAAALFAAFGFALTGILVFYSGALLYVEVTVFFSLLVLWLVLVAGNRLWRWALAGVAFGLLVICRPEMLVLLPAIVIVVSKSGCRTPTAKSPSPSPSPLKGEGMKGRGYAIRSALIMVLAAVGVIAAVPVRNYLVAREPVLFTAHSGINFYYGWNPSADGTWQQTELERTAGFSHAQLKRIARIVDGRELSWSEASSYWTKQGLAYIARNPARATWLLSRKLLLFFSNYEVPNNYYPETVLPDSLALKLAFANHGIILALGLVGIALALFWRKSRDKETTEQSAGSGHTISLSLYPLLFILAYLLSCLAFYVLSRLRAPVLPFLLVFAGFAADELVGVLRRRRWLPAGALALAAALLYTGSNLIPVDRRLYTSQAWTQAGNIYLTLGSHKAFDAFRKALAANPGNPVPRYGLFAALAGMGKVREAEAEYLELLKTAGTEPRNRVLAEMAGGRLAVARRDFAAAAAHYRKAVELDPLNAENHYLLGLVCVSLNDLPSAEQALAHAVALDPAHDDARAALEQVRARLRGR